MHAASTVGPVLHFNPPNLFLLQLQLQHTSTGAGHPAVTLHSTATAWSPLSIISRVFVYFCQSSGIGDTVRHSIGSSAGCYFLVDWVSLFFLFFFSLKKDIFFLFFLFFLALACLISCLGHSNLFILFLLWVNLTSTPCLRTATQGVPSQHHLAIFFISKQAVAFTGSTESSDLEGRVISTVNRA